MPAHKIFFKQETLCRRKKYFAPRCLKRFKLVILELIKMLIMNERVKNLQIFKVNHLLIHTNYSYYHIIML